MIRYPCFAEFGKPSMRPTEAFNQISYLYTKYTPRVGRPQGRTMSCSWYVS